MIKRHFIKIQLLCGLLIVFASCSVSKDAKNIMNSKNLLDINGHKTSIYQNISPENRAKPFVLIFLSAECPISQKYAPILRGMQEQFSDVKFIVVFTKWDKIEDINKYLNEYPLLTNTQYPITVLKDKKNALVQAIDAKITPEAFLFNNNGVLNYRGAIDNWFFALGKYRPEATENYLKDAINATLKNEPIKIKHTDAIGCIIEK
jgi:thiol-disulfide isomerase/thioredoxin